MMIQTTASTIPIVVAFERTRRARAVLAMIAASAAFATACTDQSSLLAPSSPTAGRPSASLFGGTGALGSFGKPDTVPGPSLFPPTATFVAPLSAFVGQTFTLALTNAQVPGYPTLKDFTYAFDCGGASGYAAATAAASMTCVVTAEGPRAVRAKVMYKKAGVTEYRALVIVVKAALKRQTISFTSTPPSPANMGGGYLVRATASSGLPVTLSVPQTSSHVCTLTANHLGSIVMFIGGGTCTIMAAQPGDATYAAAPAAQQAVVVQAVSTIPCTPSQVSLTGPPKC